MSKLFLVLIALFPFLGGCNSPVLILEPFEARVVDADTGEPIEGAFVIANWALFDAWSLHTATLREMVEVKETMTDKNGRFSFAGFTKANPKLHAMDRQDPQVIIFKPGYEYSKWINHCRTDSSSCPFARHTASVAGKVVKLKKLDDEARKDDKAYTRYFGLKTDIGEVLNSCGGKKIPNFIVAAAAERKRTEIEGYKWLGDLPSLEYMENLKPSCGIGREYFERHKK